MPIDISPQIDTSALVQNQQADATDVKDPIDDLIAVINNVLNGAQDADAIRFTDAAITTISGDAITAGAANMILAAQSGTADNLANVTMDNGRFVFVIADTGDTITIQHHAGGTGNIRTFSATDMDITDQKGALLWRVGSLIFVIGGGGGAADAANVTYTPSTLTDWTGSADPGNADDAFDQLAARVKALEGGGGGGGAPDNATYITQTPSAGLSAEQALSSLSTGIVKVTNGTGVLSTAVGSDLPAHNHAASDINSGQLVLERGGTEADLGATGPGHVMQATAGAVLSVVKDNLAATAAPTTGDDSGDGYSIGSRWLDTTNDKEYVALDVSVAAAVWKETTASGGGSTSYAVIADQKAQNTAGGTSSAGAWNQRDLNTEIADPDGIVSISSNRFTLVSGTYDVWTETTFRGGASNSRVRTRLYNFTDTTEVARSNNISYITSNNQGVSQINGARISTDGTKAFQLDYYLSESGRSTDGLGAAMNVSGETEQYTRIFIRKIA